MKNLSINRLPYDVAVLMQAQEIYFCIFGILYSTHAQQLDRAF